MVSTIREDETLRFDEVPPDVLAELRLMAANQPQQTEPRSNCRISSLAYLLTTTRSPSTAR